VRTVHDTLQPLPGVADVKVDLPTRMAYITVKKDEFNLDGALQALVKAEYPAKVVE